MKAGDLIKIKRSGRFATIVRERYTKRFMDTEDHEMVAHGMGHLAGTYGSAIDVVFMDNGRKRSIQLKHPATFEVISEVR